MGWHKRKKNKKSVGNEDKTSLKVREDKQSRGYEILKRESELFEKYYKEQKIVSIEEWDAFIQCLKEDLPVAFRFTGFKNHILPLVKIMKQKSLNVSQNEDEADKSLAILSLSWYPDNLGWQLNMTRKEIRSLKHLWNLHQFLISETETGNISRQEAVSMIPPLILDIKPSHKVLDMCAAPGSKTAQIIEFLHSDPNCPVPEGIVVANDSDNKRCYMLTHQAKRLQSPTLMITNHDAAFMPNIHYTKDGMLQPMKFDRILCDVPCSGDGTLRKNFDVWTKWNAVNGANLHGLQFRIARRGLEMLDVGGRLVYSTCSLNPLENEAVVNRLLLEFDSCIELIDVKNNLPGLKYVNGLEAWSVMNRNLEVLNSAEEIPTECSNYINKHLFPPTPQDAEKRNLNRCIRILPHHQNTGGFFVAVFSKLKPFPGEKIYGNGADNQSGSEKPKEITKVFKPPPRKRRCQGYKEEPFFYLEDTREGWTKLRDFYGIDTKLDGSLFLSRVKDGHGKNLYFTNSLVKDVVMQNEHRIKVINTGVKVFVKCENKGSLCDYRLSQEGSCVLFPFLTKRKLKVQKEDLLKMLLNEDTEDPVQILNLDQKTQDECEALECGSVVFVYDEENASEELPLVICIVGWKGKNSVRCYVAKNERAHFLRLLGHELLNNKQSDTEPEK